MKKILDAMLLIRAGSAKRRIQLALVLLATVFQMPTTHASARRPPMPEAFDVETVTQLLASIEQAPNSSVLKVGYFGRRIEHPLPLEEGWQLLQTAVQKAEIGSRRWFLLQSLRGSAAFQVRSASTNDGFSAYNSLFERASQAKKVRAENTVEQAINEFVNSVLGRLNGLGLTEGELTQNTLVKAWNASEILHSQSNKIDRSPGNSSALTNPPWIEAIVGAKATNKFIPVLNKSLENPDHPRKYALYRLAAEVNKVANPQKSIEFLERSKPLLPKEDIVEVAQFYDILVKNLEENGRLGDAIVAQEERIRLVRSGHTKLLSLLARNEDTKGITDLITLLLSPVANEYEVNLSAGRMEQLFSQDNKRYKFLEGKGNFLRENYIAIKRDRSVEGELRARLALAQSYIAEKDTLKAKDILKTPFTREAVPIGKARDLWAEAQKLSALLEHNKN
jgi:hypothetical protein